MRLADSSPLAFSLFALDAPVGQSGSWIQAAKVGKWSNPNYPDDVEITKDDVRMMFENFTSGKHPQDGQELPVDWEHLSIKQGRKPGDGAAAGWIQKVEIRADGNELWAFVAWNDDAADAIRKKKYKGFSPLFTKNHKAHGLGRIGPAILGGAITNYQTIPTAVLSLSTDKPFAFAEATDIPYGDRERRVRDAFQEKYPPSMKPGGDMDYASWCEVRDVYEDRAVFYRGGKLWRQSYTFGEDLSVTITGEPIEVVYADTPIAASVNPSEGVATMKVRNAQGQEVEIPDANFAAIALDSIVAVHPEVRRVVEASRTAPNAAQLQELTTSVQALSSEVNTLKTKNESLQAEANAAKQAAVEQSIDTLISEGKLVPAQREHYVAMSAEAPAFFQKEITRLKTAPKVFPATNQPHGVDSGIGDPNQSDAVVAFDSLIQTIQKEPAFAGKTHADATIEAAKRNPTLAAQRTETMQVRGARHGSSRGQ